MIESVNSRQANDPPQLSALDNSSTSIPESSTSEIPVPQDTLEISNPTIFDSTLGTTSEQQLLAMGRRPKAKLTPLHQQIKEKAAETEVKPGTNEWDSGDIVQWKAPVVGDENYVWEFKDQWVSGYSNVIKSAAAEFDLPSELVAGVAYNEVGGDPHWIDDVAYAVRSFDHAGDPLLEPLTITRKPNTTSFGDMSLQVRRAAETLGYDPNELSGAQTREIIASLRDPKQAVFIAAKHLSDLRDQDFPGVKGSQMTEKQIAVTGARYNVGPDESLDWVSRNDGYGQHIIKRLDHLQKLLSE